MNMIKFIFSKCELNIWFILYIYINNLEILLFNFFLEILWKNIINFVFVYRNNNSLLKKKLISIVTTI